MKADQKHEKMSHRNQVLATTTTSTSSQRKRKVLDEEQYIQLLENVIEQNYFPHLSTLSKQLEYLNQHEVFDLPTLRTIYQEIFPSLPTNPTPSSSSSRAGGGGGGGGGGGSLLTIENLHHPPPPSSSSSALALENTKEQMSIPQFFEQYISEDNYSFLKIQEKDLQAFRKKYHWVYEPSDHLLSITNHHGSSSNQGNLLHQIEDDPQGKTKKQRAGMLMLYYINNKVLSEEERQKIDTILAGEEKTIGDHRPNNVETWNFRVRNQLMFPPELKDSEKICQIRDNDNDQPLLIRNNILPSSSSSNNVPMIEDGKQGGGDVKGQFLVPSKPSSKIPSSRVSTQEKFIQRDNTYHSGLQFVQEIDTYLRRKQIEDNESDRFTPLEAPHTPTTISSFPPSTDSSPMLHHSLSLKNDSLVSMSPMPKPGKGLLSAPLMTWGKVIGPILEIESEVNTSKRTPVSSSSTHKESNINYSSIHQLPSSLVDDPNLPHFYLTPMNQREQVAYQLDAKRYLPATNTTAKSKHEKYRDATVKSSGIFGDQYTPSRASKEKLKGSSSSSSSSAVLDKLNSTTSKHQKRLSLQEMTPAAQLLAKKVQSTLQQKIFQNQQK